MRYLCILFLLLPSFCFASLLTELPPKDRAMEQSTNQNIPTPSSCSYSNSTRPTVLDYSKLQENLNCIFQQPVVSNCVSFNRHAAAGFFDITDLKKDLIGTMSLVYENGFYYAEINKFDTDETIKLAFKVLEPIVNNKNISNNF